MSDTTNSPRTPAVVALADFVTVGAPPPPGICGAVQATKVAHFGDAQPRQLWVFRTTSPLATDEHRRRVSAVGATVADADSDEALLAAVLSHALGLLSTQRQAQKEMARELVSLRRELNRALTALSDRHPMLGLLQTRARDDHRPFPHVQWPAEQVAGDAPVVPFAPTRQDVLELALPPMSRAAMWAEMQRLHIAIEAFEQTRIIRWTRPLRRLYGRVVMRQSP